LHNAFPAAAHRYLKPLLKNRARENAAASRKMSAVVLPRATVRRIPSAPCEDPLMTSVEDIKKAVEKLPQDKLAKFRTWFVEFDAAFFDKKPKRKAADGKKLDKLAEKAIKDLRAARKRK